MQPQNKDAKNEERASENNTYGLCEPVVKAQEHKYYFGQWN